MEDINEDEIKLLGLFRKMGVNPKADNPHDIREWMQSFVGADPEPVSNNIITHIPRIAVFSGDPTAKGEISFDLWNHEIKCLVTDCVHSQKTIAEAARRSLKGEAARVIKRLGAGAHIGDILCKLEGVFGVVELPENILAKLYSSEQMEDEDVATWSCRLEELLDKVYTQGHFQKKYSTEEMLRSRFWNGLKDSLKSRSEHKFETILDYDTLRIHMRRMECDMKSRSTVSTKCQDDIKKATVNMHVNEASKSPPVSITANEVTQLKEAICNLSEQNVDIKKQLEIMQNNYVPASSGVGKRFQDSGQYPNQSPDYYRNQNNPRYPNNLIRSATQGSYQGHTDKYVQPNGQFRGNPQTQQYNSQGYEPQCYRCGQYGHEQWGCRVILNKPLN